MTVNGIKTGLPALRKQERSVFRKVRSKHHWLYALVRSITDPDRKPSIHSCSHAPPCCQQTHRLIRSHHPATQVAHLFFTLRFLRSLVHEFYVTTLIDFLR
jgi:hypothetical protein